MVSATSPSNPTDGAAGSLKERAYAYIKQAILSSRLSPGQPLSVNELAEKMGVSRTPVREALATLHSEGFVEVFPSRGTFVTRASVADLRELSELRESLEGMATRLAAQRRTAPDLQHLASILDAAGEFQDGEGGRMVEVGTAFHEAIARIAGNGRIQRILSDISGQSAQARLFANRAHGRVEEAAKEHREILEALRIGDGVRAEQLMRDHIRLGLESALRLL